MYKPTSNGIRFRTINRQAAGTESYIALGISVDEWMVSNVCRELLLLLLPTTITAITTASTSKSARTTLAALSINECLLRSMVKHAPANRHHR